QDFGKGECNDQRTVELSCAHERGRKYHGGRPVWPDPHGMCGLPFEFADIEMVVAGGAAPIDACSRFTRYEAAILPEVLARSGTTPAVQAVNDGCGDPAGFEDQAGHRCRQRSAFADRAPDCCNVLAE